MISPGASKFIRLKCTVRVTRIVDYYVVKHILLSGVPDYFGHNKISSGSDLSHYSSASLY